MNTYKWDEKLLKEFSKNPQVAAEFEEAFAFLRKGSKVDNSHLSLIDTIFRDHTYLRLNSFCEYPIEEMLIGSPEYIKEAKYQRRIIIPQALKYTKAFYGTLSPTIQRVFQKAFAKVDGRLMAVKAKRSRFLGYCFGSKEANDYLISFSNSEDMQMCTTITHEFGHTIGFYLRDCKEPPYSYNIFCEVESCFPELLFLEFMEQNSPYYHDAIAAQIKSFNTNIEDASLVLNKYDYHYVTDTFINSSKKLNLLNYKRAIDKEYEDENLSSFLETIRYPAEDYLPYVYSYLITIELLEIWRDDPKEAFDLYYRIICLMSGSASQKNDELHKMGIQPCQSYPDYARRLKMKANNIIR